MAHHIFVRSVNSVLFQWSHFFYTTILFPVWTNRYANDCCTTNWPVYRKPCVWCICMCKVSPDEPSFN